MKHILRLTTLFTLLLFFGGYVWGQKDSWTESFDSGLANSYTTGTQTLTTGDWYTNQVYQEETSRSYGGVGHAARINDDKPNASLRTPALNTIGTVTFQYRGYSSGVSSTFVLQKSYNNNDWIQLTTQPFSSASYSEFTYDINDNASTIYVRVVNDDQANHLIVDNFQVTNYSSSCSGEPTVQATNISLSNETDESIDVSWTAGTGGDNYVLVVKEASNVSWTPTDDADYSAQTGSGDFSAATDQSNGNKVVFAGSGTSTTVTGLSASTDYYFQVFHYCSNDSYNYLTSSGTENDGSQNTSTTAVSYCTPAPTSGDGDGITNVTMGSINNTTGQEVGYYGDYSAQSTDVEQGATVDCDITFETGYSYNTKIWVDWNIDGDFEDSGEEVYSGESSSNDPTTLSASFSVPVDASLGSRRLRIGGADVATPTPCYTGTYAIFEDYTINVVAATIDPEPTNHASTFLAGLGTDGTDEIDLLWDDNDGAQAADGFLIVGRTSTGSFYTPVDETDPSSDTDWSDGDFEVKVNHGVETYSLSGLDPSTQYFFKIYAYTNSGSDIDFKTDGTVPDANATTNPEPPVSLTLTVNGSDEINVAWTKNGNDDDILVVFDLDGTFTEPENGTTYSVSSIALGGTVIYNGSGDSFDHTGLSAETIYAYRIWSVDGNNNYSTGLEDFAETLKGEPTNHASGFTATANGASQIKLTWNDNDDAQAADGFLIVGKTGSASFYVPSDGTEPGDDTDWTDDEFEVKVAHGVQSYNVTGLDAETTYDFKIYPYTNSGSNIVFKTDGTVPTDDATTDEAPAVIAVQDFDGTSPTWDYSNDVAFFDNGWNDDGYYGLIDISSASPLNYANFSSNIIGENDLNDEGNGTTGFATIDFEEINISAYTNVVLTFDWQVKGYNANDDDAKYVLFYDGAGQGDVYLLDGNGSPEDGEGTVTINVPDGINTIGLDIMIRDDGGSGFSGFDNFTLTGEENITTWTGGAATTDWNTAGNWSDGTPNASTSAVIPAAKASVEIAADQTADCYNLTVEGSLTIQSDATGMGSLITNGTVSGTATYNLYVSKYDNSADYKYHYISSPVTAQSIRPDFVANTPATNVDFLKWEPQTGDLGTWINTKNGTSWNDDFEDNFVVGRGYMVAYPSIGTKAFTGILNTGDINLVTTTNLYQGWNLIGNPYPSYLDWDEVALSATNMDLALYYYDNDNEEYNAYIRVDGDAVTTNTATKEIPPLQGFMVYSSDASGQALTLSNSHRIHGTQGYFKEEKELQNPVLKLNLQKDERGSEMAVVIYGGATEAYDSKYDAFKVLSYNQTVPEIYSMTSEETKLAINTRNAGEGEFVIPVSVKYGTDGEFAINVSEFANLGEWKVTLEDKMSNEFTELSSASSYVFTASTSDAADRFLLHFKSTTAVEDMETLDASIYTYDHKIYISGLDAVNNATVELFTVDGRRILAEQFAGAPVVQIGQELPLGCYVVRLTSENQTMSKKIVLN